ncbi:zinc finger protein ADR1 [Rhypophila sp. PSN 637]
MPSSHSDTLDNIVVKPKRFKCHRCQRLFGRLEHLQRHERTHTQERPFACVQCESRFTRSDLLIRHERLSHQKEKRVAQQTQTNDRHDIRKSAIEERVNKRQRKVDEMAILEGGLDNFPTPPQTGSRFEESTNFAVAEEDYQLLYSNPENGKDGAGGELVGSHGAQGLVGLAGDMSSEGRDSSPGLLEQEGTGRLPMSLEPPDSIALALPILTESPPSITSTNSNSDFPDPDLIFPFIAPDQISTISPFSNEVATTLPLPDFTTLLDADSGSSYEPLYHFEPLISVDMTQPGRVLRTEAFVSSDDEPSGNGVSHHQHDNGHTPAPMSPEFESTLLSVHREEPQNIFAATHHQQPNLLPANGWLSHLCFRDRAQIETKMAEFDDIRPWFRLPTNLSLARYLRSYIEGFHRHLPFLHIPTLTVQSCPVELLLAMAAVGTQYCFEADKGVDLFTAARAIASERIKRRDIRMARSSVTGTADDLNLIPTAQALLILMAMATWSNHQLIVQEATRIQSILGGLVREDGLVQRREEISDTHETWQTWSRAESTLRTKYIVYCFSNLHSIIYKMSPHILSSEISMRLPCSAAEFQATTEAEWRRARAANARPAAHFQAAFQTLLSPPQPSGGSESPTHSSLGNYILIHAIIQQILGMREFSNSAALPPEAIRLMQGALSKWQLDWERSPESSLDPIDHNNPMSFNSMALLRLAYIRLNISPGSGGLALKTRDPALVAQALRNLTGPPQRSPALTAALHHAARAFGIPVMIGINLVAKTQTFTWSIQHSLCALECALLLSKWLEAVANVSGVDDSLSPTDKEYDVLEVLKMMLAETKFALPEGPRSLQDTARHISIGVLRVWASIFKGSQTWAVVDIIGTSLDLYADMLDKSDVTSMD